MKKDARSTYSEHLQLCEFYLFSHRFVLYVLLLIKFIWFIGNVSGMESNGFSSAFRTFSPFVLDFIVVVENYIRCCLFFLLFFT